MILGKIRGKKDFSPTFGATGRGCVTGRGTGLKHLTSTSKRGPSSRGTKRHGRLICPPVGVESTFQRFMAGWLGGREMPRRSSFLACSAPNPALFRAFFAFLPKRTILALVLLGGEPRRVAQPKAQVGSPPLFSRYFRWFQQIPHDVSPPLLDGLCRCCWWVRPSP